MNKQRRDELRGKLERATKGEWTHYIVNGRFNEVGSQIDDDVWTVGNFENGTDAAFIAAAKNSMLDILDLADRIEAELAQMRARCEAAEGDIREMVTNRLMGFCMFCKHRNKPDLRYMPCKKCRLPNGSRSAFAWRGPQQKGAGHEQGR
jgi:hypothetical protein